MEDIICSLISCDQEHPLDPENAVWRLSYFWAYPDGTFSVCDEDGDHDDVEEDEIPSWDEIKEGEDAYYQWVSQYGKDPLNQLHVSPEISERTFEVFYRIDGDCLEYITALEDGKVVDLKTVKQAWDYFFCDAEGEGRLKIEEIISGALIVDQTPTTLILRDTVKIETVTDQRMKEKAREVWASEWIKR